MNLPEMQNGAGSRRQPIWNHPTYDEQPAPSAWNGGADVAAAMMLMR